MGITDRLSRASGASPRFTAPACGGATRVLWIFAAAAIAATAGSVSGQAIVPDEPVFVWRGIGEGLSHAAVHALLQAEDGFLWVGTAVGLNRFDGVDFRVFKHHPDSAASLGDDHVRALANARGGRLWVGTERGGLNRFDPATGRAERFELRELGPWAMDAAQSAAPRHGRTVSAIVPWRNRTLLLATDRGLALFDTRAGTAVPVSPAILQPDPAGTPLCAVPGGGALAALPEGEVLWIEDKGQASRTIVRLDEPISALRCHTGDRAWAGTASGRVFSLDLVRGGADLLGTVVSATGASLEVHDIAAGPDGHLWIATGRGPFVLPHEGGQSRLIGAGRLVETQIHRFLTDATGMLWIGTWNGLAALHPANVAIERIPNRAERGPGPFGRGVVAIHSAGDDELWLGTYDAGVVMLRQTDRGWSPARIRALDPLRAAFVSDITPGLDGSLWIATLRDGVFRLDASRRSLAAVPIETHLGERAQPLLYSTFVDRVGDVWLGSGTLGLLRYDDTRRAFVEYRGPAGDFDYGNDYVWPIAEGADGSLWVGAFNGGLSRLDPDRTSLRLYTPERGGLGDSRILTLLPDRRGGIWIGTEGGGTQRLDLSTGRWSRYSTADGLPHDIVAAILEDADGILWISTAAGIARLVPETGETLVLTESAGLLGNRFFANSAWKAADGRLFFGGPDGVTIIDPSLIRPLGSVAPVAITRFLIRNEEQPLSRVRAAGGLDLGPHETFFTFEFAALDFRQPALNRYRYQLVRLDDAWIEAGTARIANYTSVPAGRYTFRVRGINAEGAWSFFGLTIPVRVRPPYHRTWWFRTAVAAAVVAITAGLFAYRMRELRRRQHLRLGIAGRLHDDIGANLAAIALKAEMIGHAPGLDGKRRRQVADVGRLARDTTLQLRETLWVVNAEYDTLPGLIAKLRDTADILLGDRIEFDFDAPASLPDRPLDMERRQSFYFVFKEALQNIVKHSGATHVGIVVTADARHVSCMVRDDGKGFDPPLASGGNGLGLMRRHARRFGGDLTIDSAPGQGTTVLLRIRR